MLDVYDQVHTEVISELSRLLDAAAASPVTLQPPKTKRDEREELAAVYKFRDEKIFGPGGQKADKKRMYGKCRSATESHCRSAP